MNAIEPEKRGTASEDRIATIAHSIMSAYGDDALLVVQRQLELADHDSRQDWLAILDQLQRR